MKTRSLIVLALRIGALQAGDHDMVAIPDGNFTMGRTKLTSDDKTNMRPHVLLDDRPAHTVRVSSFKLDSTEVTNAQYERFVQATRHRVPYHWETGHPSRDTGQIPVYNVSWDDADSYCHWAGKRLPTEAEWERAARGGLDGADYPWEGKATAELARYNVDSGPGPVATFPPNSFGLYDLAGNVSEWVADWFDGDYYKSGQNQDPKGPPSGDYKVIRGGAWSDSAARITVFFRNWVRPNQRTPNIGFRCAQ